jgi:small acid-soluble spore protein D (minor alpha/beta-type SASP)
MKDKGYAVDPNHPNNVKYEVARSLGIPLQPGYNGGLKSEDAGKIGGPIGGAMVREMVRMAQEQLANQQRPHR